MIKISYLEGNKLFTLQIFLRVKSLLSLVVLSVMTNICRINLIKKPSKLVKICQDTYHK
jgi:hypothetical protein